MRHAGQEQDEERRIDVDVQDGAEDVVKGLCRTVIDLSSREFLRFVKGDHEIDGAFRVRVVAN